MQSRKSEGAAHESNWASRFTPRLMSRVAADCSSTAAARLVWISLMWPMVWPMRPMAETASAASAWMVSIRP